MAQTSINIRMDEELKKQFDIFCSAVGMSMTTAFCIFAKKVVSERRIPFEISMPVIEIEPDDFDKKMIMDSKTNNEDVSSLDNFVKELGFEPNDLRI